MRENIWKNIKLGFKTNKLAVVGAAAIILLALISIFAFLYPVDPNAISATERLNAPSMAHLFGTDDMGRYYLKTWNIKRDVWLSVCRKGSVIGRCLPEKIALEQVFS